MLDEVLAALAITGSTTMVAAMATDAWAVTRAGIARLFRRGDRRAAIEAQLDDHAALVAAAEDAKQVQRSLTPVWQLHLETLLRDHPDAAEELREVIAETTAALPQTQQNWVQTVIARENGTSFGVQGGNINIHYDSPGPGPGER